jgi:hypothetical protein
VYIFVLLLVSLHYDVFFLCTGPYTVTNICGNGTCMNYKSLYTVTLKTSISILTVAVGQYCMTENRKLECLMIRRGRGGVLTCKKV